MRKLVLHNGSRGTQLMVPSCCCYGRGGSEAQSWRFSWGSSGLRIGTGLRNGGRHGRDGPQGFAWPSSPTGPGREAPFQDARRWLTSCLSNCFFNSVDLYKSLSTDRVSCYQQSAGDNELKPGWEASTTMTVETMVSKRQEAFAAWLEGESGAVLGCLLGGAPKGDYGFYQSVSIPLATQCICHVAHVVTGILTAVPLLNFTHRD